MSKRLFTLFCTMSLWALPASADPLRIVTDILPVQSLAVMVAGDLAETSVTVRPGASPHGYALRPSEAAALQQADLVIWMGEGLTPWLAGPIINVAGDAEVIALLDVDGIELLDIRTGTTFGEHEDDHGHDDDHAHEDEHGHDHDGGSDPHAWLSPGNAKLWLNKIAETLARLDPANEAAYASNAREAAERIDEAARDTAARLAPVRSRSFVVFHDAFHYFEDAFGLSAAGSLALSDATPASAARIAEITEVISDRGVGCVFAEPQFDPRLVEAVGRDASTKVAVLDPLGVGLGSVGDVYPALIRTLGVAIADCLN